MDTLVFASAVPAGLIFVVGAVLAVIVGIIVLVKMMWKVAEPDEALIVSGFGAAGEDGLAGAAGAGFRIIVGKGTFVIPGLQSVRSLSLAAHKADLTEECVTKQGIPVQVRGVVVYKVGDSLGEIANASRRFLDRDEDMGVTVNQVFAGHLRSIIGSMTVEQIIGEREALASQTRESSSKEMERLGLMIDSLQIQEVKDPTGYIENIAAPHQAAVAASARIAAAERDQEATQKEQEAASQKAQATADSQIAQAQATARTNQEQARAAQAGPLADAEARQQVVIASTKIAELEATRTERELLATVVKPAEAEKQAQIARAEAEKQTKVLGGQAEAEVTKTRGMAQAAITEATGKATAAATEATGLAEAKATEAKGLAEAKAIEARAHALKENQEAVIGQQIAERLPEVVRAAASALQGADHLTILNGAEGVAEFMNSALATGMSVLPMFRDMVKQTTEASKPNETPRGSRVVEQPALVEETPREEV
jgi:flotillin